jgi:hypothetical protein
LSRENRPATPMPKHRRRCGQSNHDQELTRSRGSQRRLASEPPEGGTGVGPWPKPRTLRAQRRSPPKWGGTGFVGISRSSRLQGFAPLTSPLRHVAVASDLALVSSMGFVVPSKIPCAPHHPGDASTGESPRSSRSSALEDPCLCHRGKPWRRGPMGSLRGFTRSLVAEAGGERRRQAGAEAESLRRAFSAWWGNPLPRPDRASGRSRRWRVWAVLPESVRSARS